MDNKKLNSMAFLYLFCLKLFCLGILFISLFIFVVLIFCLYIMFLIFVFLWILFVLLYMCAFVLSPCFIFQKSDSFNFYLFICLLKRKKEGGEKRDGWVRMWGESTSSPSEYIV